MPLKDALALIDWTPLHRGTAEDAATFFMEMLWMTLCIYIPYEEVQIKKKSHPWLNAACESAIAGKNAAVNTATFELARAKCTRVLKEEQDKYIVKLRTKISHLFKDSKEAWKLNRVLLSKQGKCSSMLPLRDGTKWLNEPKDEANLLKFLTRRRNSLQKVLIVHFSDALISNLRR